MSTISTHLNWGASYIVNDFYKQQITLKLMKNNWWQLEESPQYF